MREGARTRFARRLRHDMTGAERHLWTHLRRRRLGGYRFRRQHPLGPWIADFACLEAGLVVEIDGSPHLGSARDSRRDAWFEVRGFRVLRFWNNDVLARTDDVLAMILDCLAATLPHPDLPPQAGEGVQ